MRDVEGDEVVSGALVVGVLRSVGSVKVSGGDSSSITSSKEVPASTSCVIGSSYSLIALLGLGASSFSSFSFCST